MSDLVFLYICSLGLILLVRECFTLKAAIFWLTAASQLWLEHAGIAAAYAVGALAYTLLAIFAAWSNTTLQEYLRAK